MSGGTITRKDLITDEGLEFGKEYAKNIRLAIEANDDLVDSAKALAQIANSYQKANNSQAFITAKNEEKLALQRVENAIKAEEVALKSAEKIKQETLRTKKLELDAINKEEAAKRRTTKLTVEERVQNEVNNRVLKQAVLAKLNLTEAYTKLNNSRTQAKNKLRELIITEGESSKATIKARQEFEKLDAQIKRADKAVGDFTKNVGNYPTIGKLTTDIKNLAGAFGIAAGTAAFASVVKGAIKIVREYEEEIVNLAAIAGKSRKEIAPLEAEIRNVAKSSINSATEVAKLATELIKLGSTEEEAKLLLKPINDLSVALRASAEDSATLVKSLLNTFGEGADQATRYTDVLAASANYTALGFDELRDSMSYVAPVANAMGYSIEKTAAMVGVLADNGIKAESAGRLLRTMMGNAAKEGTTLEKQLEKVANSTDEVKTASALFGAEGASLGIILANNKDRVAELTKEFENSKGSLDELTNKQLQSANAQMKILDSTWEEFILSIENGDGAISRFFVKGIKLSTQLLENFIALNKTVEDRSNEYFKSLEDGFSESKKASDKYFQDEFDKNEKIKESQLKALEVLEKKLAIEKETFNYKYLANRKDAVDVQKQIDLLNEQIKLTELSQAKIKSKIETDKTSRANLEQEYAILFTSINKQVTSQDALDYARQKSTKRLQEEIDMLKNKNKTTDEGTEADKKAIAAAEKARADYLTKLKKQEDDIYALQKFRLDRSAELNDEITADENESIQDRIDAYLDSEQLKIASLDLTLEHELVSNALSLIDSKNTSIEKMKSIENEARLKAKQLSDGVELSENASNTEKLIYEKYLSEKEILSKKEVQDKQKIIDSIIAIEQKKTDKILQNQDTELNKRLEAENKLYAENLELLKGNQAEIEALTLKHEEEVFNIKKEYAKKALTEQINALQTLLDAEAKKPEAERISADKIADIQNKISKYRVQLSEEDLKNAEFVANRKVELEKEAVDLIRELQTELTSTMKDLVFALFDAKIQKIDEDIEANDAYYAQQLEMAEGDAAQQDLIEKERDKKRKLLEKERRKEEFKAALARRIMAVAEIGIELAKTIMSINAAAAAMDAITPFAFGATGLGYRGVQLPLAIGLSAAQTALVLASPLPKYEEGTKGKPHKGGKALVGEVRPEVILEPGKNPYVVSKPTVLDLKRGTEVIPSIDEYQKLQRASILASLDMEGKKAKNYRGNDAFNARYDAELLEELRRNTEATKKNKSNVVVQNNIDLGHEIWKLSNIKWGA